MQDFQQRVVDEKKELDEKVTKLRAFIHTEQFDSLDGNEKIRLWRQADAMGVYSSVLGERIEAFK